MAEDMETPKQKESDQIPADLQVETPVELYTRPDELLLDGNTFWARMRAWSHRSKRIVYIVFIGTLIGGFGYLMMQETGPDLSQFLSRYFNRFGNETPDWTYQIGQYQIDRDYLRRLYPVLANYTYGKAGARTVRQDAKVYEEFLNQQFEMDLMAYAAWKSGALNDPEAKLIIGNAIRRAAADYYLYKNIQNDANDFRTQVSDQEVIQFYSKNRSIYEKQGMDKKQAFAMIRGTLSELKSDRVRTQLQTGRRVVLDRLRNEIGPRFRSDH